MSQKINISIIIPTLNEADNIRYLLDYLHSMDGNTEIIVSDGGSTDGTIELVSKELSLCTSPRGRGIQMNRGAKSATGEVLWFLHADCRPHPQSIYAISRIMQNSKVAGGAFEFNLSQKGIIYRVTEFFSNRKNRLFSIFYGEMGIFVRRNIFKEMGGFKEILIMEDIDFCLRLKKQGKIVILPHRILSSARRWVEEGPVKNLIRNWILQILWITGINTNKLAHWYPPRIKSKEIY